MNWYYESGGQQHGPVPDSELDRLLAEGAITPDTLIWRDGLPGWAPLRTARPAASSTPPPGAPPDDLGYEVTRPGTPAAGAPPTPPAGDVPPPGYIRCSLTGKYCPPSEIIYIEGKPYSAEAKPQVVQSLQSGFAAPTGGFERSGPPWEQREQLGFMKAIWETMRVILTQPAFAFANMKQTGGLGSPIFFWAVTAGIGVLVNQLYGLIFQGAMFGMMSNMGGMGPGQAGGAFAMNTAMQAVMVVLSPLIGFVILFIYAGLAHLSLMMLKGANRPFETTFRAVAYAMGAGGLLNLVPICGGFVAGIWSLVVLCIGLGKAQDTSTEKGVGGALIPMALCCGMYAVGIAIFAAIIGVSTAAASAP